jgi:N-acyl-D-amino-acid deacylase
MLTRREFLKDAALLGAAGIAVPLISCGSSYTYDIVIRNGTVYDGTTAAPFVADVGIRGDRIISIGNLSDSAVKTIDARNRIVAPGFIDVHDHTDYTFRGCGADRELARGNQVWCSNRAGLLQGVTTVISGNCGYGYSDMDDYYTFLDSLPFGPNTCYLTPHGYLRQDLFGEDTKSLTAEQLNRLKAKVAQEMEKGAIGMSTGLGYVPGISASKGELVELGKVLKRYNGIYVSHIRNEPPSDYTKAPAEVMEGILEAIDIGRQAGIPVQISHIKGYIGGTAADFDAICQTIEDARKEGIDVTADQYPFLASSTVLSVLAPPDYRTATGIKRLYWDDPNARKAIRNAVAVTFMTLKPVDIIITGWTSAKTKRTYQNKNLQYIADEETREPDDLYVEMVCAEDCPAGIFFVINEGAMKQLMSREYVFTGSDGCAVPEQASYGHPRSTATFAKKLRVYAMDEKVMSLQSAILSMTSRPAEKFGIKERGKIVPGYYADLCVIDTANLKAPATYDNPSAYSEGVTHVIVNGVFEVENSSATGVRNGRTLRRS